MGRWKRKVWGEGGEGGERQSGGTFMTHFLLPLPPSHHLRSPTPPTPPSPQQAFTSKGFQFLTQTYLPRKLREGDWV
jgi:hypothetical protein